MTTIIVAIAFNSLMQIYKDVIPEFLYTLSLENAEKLQKSFRRIFFGIVFFRIYIYNSYNYITFNFPMFYPNFRRLVESQRSRDSFTTADTRRSK